MNKQILKVYFLLFFITVCMFGCVSKMYKEHNVSGEDEYIVTKINENTELVIGPSIIEKKYKIYWYTTPFIDISNDGKYLAYLVRKNASNNVFVKDLETNIKAIQKTFEKNIVDFALSPDGKSIAFSNLASNRENIFLINTQKANDIKQLTYNDDKEMGINFSYDGSEIYYARRKTETLSDGKTIADEIGIKRYQIWSYNLKSNNQVKLYQGFTPSITLDKKILLVTRTNLKTHKGEIWSINLETGKERVLVRSLTKGFSTPVISPDGKKVLCVGSTLKHKRTPLNLNIYLFNINGSGLQQLTYHPGSDVSPCWSPDMKSIYFLSQRGNIKKLFNVWKMNLE